MELREFCVCLQIKEMKKDCSQPWLKTPTHTLIPVDRSAGQQHAGQQERSGSQGSAWAEPQDSAHGRRPKAVRSLVQAQGTHGSSEAEVQAHGIKAREGQGATARPARGKARQQGPQGAGCDSKGPNAG